MKSIISRFFITFITFTSVILVPSVFDDKLYFDYNSGILLAAQDNTDGPPVQEGNGEDEDGDDRDKRTVIRYAYPLGIVAGTYAYAFSTWGWSERDHWKWSNEGFFGRGTPYGGSDKIGHLFSHYCMMRLSANVFGYTEKGRERRLFYAGLLTMLVGLSIEMGDAYSGYGFSYHDLIFDSTGVLIGGLLEAFPRIDSFASLSIEYVPSSFFRRHPGKFSKMPDDFSGMIVMANLKLSGFRDAGFAVPEFIRYISLDVGYGTRGYTSFDRRAAWEKYRFSERSQNLYLGISVNFMEVMKDIFGDAHGLARSAAKQFFKYYHLPVGYKHGFVLSERPGRPR